MRVWYHNFMLNLFPGLLIPMLGPVILRLVIGLIFIDLGVLKFRAEKSRWLASFEALSIRPADLFVPVYALLQIIGGILLILGLWSATRTSSITELEQRHA